MGQNVSSATGLNGIADPIPVYRICPHCAIENLDDDIVLHTT